MDLPVEHRPLLMFLHDAVFDFRPVVPFFPYDAHNRSRSDVEGEGLLRIFHSPPLHGIVVGELDVFVENHRFKIRFPEGSGAFRDFGRRFFYNYKSGKTWNLAN